MGLWSSRGTANRALVPGKALQVLEHSGQKWQPYVDSLELKIEHSREHQVQPG